jgi:hypothetical protein
MSLEDMEVEYVVPFYVTNTTVIWKDYRMSLKQKFQRRIEAEES